MFGRSDTVIPQELFRHACSVDVGLAAIPYKETPFAFVKNTYLACSMTLPRIAISLSGETVSKKALEYGVYVQ